MVSVYYADRFDVAPDYHFASCHSYHWFAYPGNRIAKRVWACNESYWFVPGTIED